MATQPPPKPALSDEPHFKTSNRTVLTGCLTAPLICLVAVVAWFAMYFLTSGSDGTLFLGLLIGLPIWCLIASILGLITGAAVAHFESIFKAAGMSALVSWPFGVALGTFCSGSDTTLLANFTVLVTLIGTVNGVIVTAIHRPREGAEKARRRQLRLNELLFLCMLIAIGLLTLGVEYRRIHTLNSQQPETGAPHVTPSD